MGNQLAILLRISNNANKFLRSSNQVEKLLNKKKFIDS